MKPSRDCIIFATADWKTPYWTNKQHTARHLAGLGFRVLYVESIGLRAPTINRKDMKRIWHRLFKGFQKPSMAEKNLWVLSPLLIPYKHHWPIMRAINRRLLAWQLQRFIQQQAFKQPLIWTYHPFVLEAIQGIDHQQVLYHCVDDLAAVPGIDAIAFNQEEKKLLKACDVVFTTSELLQEKCVTLNKNTYHFPNVADISHFSKGRISADIPLDLAQIPTPRIGYVGALSDYKVDFSLILSVATSHPEWHWVLIGDEREGQRNAVVDQLRTLPNVHFLGYRSYDVLPHYLSGLDVATLPSLLNNYTRAMFPMKYFEYLAAGLPIVSTSLAFTETHKAGLEVGNSALAFSDAITKQLARGRLTDQESDEHVADNSWDQRLKKMLAIVGITSHERAL